MHDANDSASFIKIRDAFFKEGCFKIAQRSSWLASS